MSITHFTTPSPSKFNPHLLSGATRLYYIVGDPIAQVKSPAGVSQTLQDLGVNALVVPAHVSPSDLPAWFAGAARAQNVDGVIVTIPHKFDCFKLCDTTGPAGQFLGAVNTLRRGLGGAWHGDMFDGQGFCQALKNGGCTLEGRSALLVGAGGAGSAIAYELVMQGVSRLAVCDPDTQRQNALIARLSRLNRCAVTAGSNSAEGFDLALNASPMGMQAHDPYPIDPITLSPHTFVGCVITAPAVSPWLQAARALGCTGISGADMFACVRDLMVAFLLEHASK